MTESEKAVMQQALDALKNSCDFVFKDINKAHLRDRAIAALEAAIAQPEQPNVNKAVAYRYKFKNDLQWQYTETIAHATQPCEIQHLYIAQTEQPNLGIKKGETMEQAAEGWAQWCEARGNQMLADFLRKQAAIAQPI